MLINRYDSRVVFHGLAVDCRGESTEIGVLQSDCVVVKWITRFWVRDDFPISLSKFKKHPVCDFYLLVRFANIEVADP